MAVAALSIICGLIAFGYLLWLIGRALNRTNNGSSD
jgi:hypothetical protein